MTEEELERHREQNKKMEMKKEELLEELRPLVEVFSKSFNDIESLLERIKDHSGDREYNEIYRALSELGHLKSLIHSALTRANLDNGWVH